jgi:hypothetical protein
MITQKKWKRRTLFNQRHIMNRIQEKLIHFLVIIPLKEYQTYSKHDKVHHIILIPISHD